ncbi:MAG: hypothetical protein C5B47_03275, partial [Verrucomicrobia bacterium]
SPNWFNFVCAKIAGYIFCYPAKLHVLGLENLPLSGAFLLIANHISHFDPPILSSVVPRPVEWIATRELFEGPISGRFLRWVGGIPLDRIRGDGHALREAIHRLRNGAVVGIFPEGGIRSGENSLLSNAWGKPGFTTLATLSRAPIIPCAILGSDRLYETKYWNPVQQIVTRQRASIWIAFGKPMDCPTSLPRQHARSLLQNQIIASIRSLAASLKEHFGLQAADFPQTAQQRRGQKSGPKKK